MAVAAYLRVALEPEDVFWTSIDHGAGKLTAAAAGNAKGRGCKAGLPDVWVFVRRDGLCLVIAIELKTRMGRVSPVQLDTATDLVLAGVRCHVARSVEEVEAILDGHGVPLRARSLPLWKARAA